MHKALLCAFMFKFLFIKKKVRNKTVWLLNIHSHVKLSLGNLPEGRGERREIPLPFHLTVPDDCRFPPSRMETHFSPWRRARTSALVDSPGEPFSGHILFRQCPNPSVTAFPPLGEILSARLIWNIQLTFPIHLKTS